MKETSDMLPGLNADESQENRIVILPNKADDASLIRATLDQSGMRCEFCEEIEEFCRQIELGAAVAVVMDSAFDRDALFTLRWTLSKQPEWSDLPLVLVIGEGKGINDNTLKEIVKTIGPAMILERPFKILTLVSAVRILRQARRRQYELRDYYKSLEEQVQERTATISLLHDIASAANRATKITEALQYTLMRVCQENGWFFGHAYMPSENEPDLLRPVCVWYEKNGEEFEKFLDATLKNPLRYGQSLPGRVFQSGKPEWTTDIKADLTERRADAGINLGIGTALAFPVVIRNRIAAVMEFFAEREIKPDRRIMESMVSIGTQVGRVIERKEFEQQIAEIAECERRRMGEQLHDGVGQQMTGIAMLVRSLQQKVAGGELPEQESVDSLVRYIEDAKSDIRRLARGMMPVEVDAEGLMAALSELAERTEKMYGVSCRFEFDEPILVENNFVATHLYHVAQEAVHNSVKHGEPREVTIGLHNREGIVLQVKDDGKGIDSEAKHPEGMGLRIMRNRANLISAELEIDSREGAGVEVRCALRK